MEEQATISIESISVSMTNWDKMEHDFGNVSENNTYSCEFNYIGDWAISNISVSCGCTAVSSVGEVNSNKTLRVSLNIGGLPPAQDSQLHHKSIGITYDLGGGMTQNEHLILKATAVR